MTDPGERTDGRGGPVGQGPDSGTAAPAGKVGLRPAATVLAVAGGVWWGVAAGPAVDGTGATAAWVAAGVVVAALVVLLARRLPADGADEAMRTNGRAYGLVNLAQVAGILAVGVVAGRQGVPQWIPVGVTAVFAVHFLPFARLFRWRGYTGLAAALLLVAAAGAVLAATGSPPGQVHAVVGPAVAVVLWGTVVLVAPRRPRARTAAASGDGAVAA